jgi:integrase/recombinase XerD
MTAGATGRLISAFLDAQAATANAARNTLLAYGRDLSDFAAWATGRSLVPEAARRDDIAAYILHCDALGLSAATRARRLSAIRAFFRFLHDEGHRADNPALRLSGPPRAQRLPGTLTLAEVERLIAAARDLGRGEAARARHAALLELLYATGLRVSELVSLPVAAVRGDPAMILVRGKGGRERMVPLSRPARAAVGAWLAHRDAAEDLARREAGAAPSRFLFPGAGAAGHLTRQHLHGLLKDMAVRAGIPPSRVTPHVLRHAFATHLLQGGADLRVIQTLLGHADIATTEIYTHVAGDHLRDLVLTKHPLAGD